MLTALFRGQIEVSSSYTFDEHLRIRPARTKKKTFIQCKWGVRSSALVSAENVPTYVFLSPKYLNVQYFHMMQTLWKKLNYTRGCLENWIELSCRSFIVSANEIYNAEPPWCTYRVRRINIRECVSHLCVWNIFTWKVNHLQECSVGEMKREKSNRRKVS